MLKISLTYSAKIHLFFTFEINSMILRLLRSSSSKSTAGPRGSSVSEGAQERDSSRELFRYRNMEFWNTYFNVIAQTANFTFDHASFIRGLPPYPGHGASSAQSRVGPHLSSSVLCKWFGGPSGLGDQSSCILEKQLVELSSAGVIRELFLDWENSSWENDTAVFVSGAVHPTKARLAVLVAAKYGE